MSLRIEQAQDAVFERGAEANVFNSLRSPHARVIPSNVRLAGERLSALWIPFTGSENLQVSMRGRAFFLREKGVDSDKR